MLPESYITDYVAGDPTASQSPLGTPVVEASDGSITRFLDDSGNCLDRLLQILTDRLNSAISGMKDTEFKQEITLARAYLLMLVLVCQHTAPWDARVLEACESTFFRTNALSPVLPIRSYIHGKWLPKYKPWNDTLWYVKSGMFRREPFPVVKRERFGELCAILGDPLVAVVGSTSKVRATRITKEIRAISLEDDEWTFYAILQKLRDQS